MSDRLRLLLPACAAFLAVFAVASCGAGDPTALADGAAGAGGADVDVVTDPVDAPTTTTVVGPTTVVVAGDSIIYDVAPALAAALDPDTTTVVPLVAPSIAASSSRDPLLRQVTETGADLVIVMVGVWERGHVTGTGLRLGDPGWGQAYTSEALDPVLDALATTGARLLILGPPRLREATSEAEIAVLEAVWAAYADEYGDVVRFADADEWLGAVTAYTELETTGDGTAIRLRRTDGVHLCEEGARRIAQGILDVIPQELAGRTTALVPGWETAEWTSRFPDDECPDPG